MSQNESVSKTFENIIKQMRGISLALNENLREDINRFIESQKQLSTALGSLVEYQSQQIENLIIPAFIKLAESYQSYPSLIQTALMVLGNHGWFFDLEMPLPFLWELEKALENDNRADAEAALVEYFRERLPSIEKWLNEKFSHRTKIIGAAFKAHAHGDYELSIPVFLAQSDGICYEVIKHYLFKRKDRKPSTAEYVETIASDTFRSALLFPFSHPLPISAPKHERGEFFNELNRHQVLHGEVLDYGTEINSLKSISLLNYVAQQVLRLDDGEK